MLSHHGEYKLRSMADCLEVASSTYYDHFNRMKREEEKNDIQLLEFVYNVWKKNKKSYGLRKILKEVKKASLPWGARKIKKAMKTLNIKGKQVKKFRVKTTDSEHENRIAPDLVKRNFTPSKKNQVWVSDVTFIASSVGWLYLCVILDLYSRKVVGWTLSDKNDSSLIELTLQKAILSRNPEQGLIFHSDRGSNYCSYSVRQKLIENRIRRSNSRKGNCWDNAVAESFFSTLKREIEFNVFLNRNDAEQTILDYIDVFYNRQRSHSFLSYVSPDEFELKAA